MSAEANASSSGDASASAELDAEGESSEGQTARASEPVPPTWDSATTPGRVLLGARHDLKLIPGKGTATCECLSVALGPARSGGMQWSSAPPDLDDTTQLAVALSSEGVECKGEPKGSLGASYWGYRISGNDVVVLVESAGDGHPLTSGAVIPRPVGEGSVYVKPAAKRLPYGRPVDGKGLCKIGNPGHARASAFTELELGQDAPAARSKASAAESTDPNDMPTTIELPAN